MAAVTGNPLDAALVKALGDTLTVWLGPVTILRGWTNRVSTPSTRYFVQITPSGGTPHGTTGHVYTGPEEGVQGQALVVRPKAAECNWISWGLMRKSSPAQHPPCCKTLWAVMPWPPMVLRHSPSVSRKILRRLTTASRLNPGG